MITALSDDSDWDDNLIDDDLTVLISTDDSNRITKFLENYNDKLNSFLAVTKLKKIKLFYKKLCFIDELSRRKNFLF